MIIFFTFDIGLLLGFIAIAVYMFAHGTEAAFQVLVSHYSTAMLVAFIISIVASLFLGFLSESIEDNSNAPTTNYITSAIYYALTVPPVIMLAVNETFGFLSNFAGKNGFLWMVFFGFLFFIIYAVVTTLILLVGIGIPVLIKKLIAKIGYRRQPALNSFLYTICGVVIAIIYYNFLKNYQIFPFSTVLT